MNQVSKDSIYYNKSSSIMNTIRRGLKWKEPGQDPEAEDYQAGLKSVSGLNQSNICRILKHYHIAGCCTLKRVNPTEV